MRGTTKRYWIFKNPTRRRWEMLTPDEKTRKKIHETYPDAPGEVGYYLWKKRFCRPVFVSGFIGQCGSKVHRFCVWVINYNGADYIMDAVSWCGTRRMTQGGYSPITILEGKEITCKKCRAI
jgi:hypothetical protein